MYGSLSPGKQRGSSAAHDIYTKPKNHGKAKQQLHPSTLTIGRVPIFDGNLFRYPAVEFINDFEEYVGILEKKYVLDSDELRMLFQSCLEYDALSWMKVFGVKYGCFETLKAAFLRRFWSFDVQRRVKQQLMFGTYRQRGKLSKMACYFMGILRRTSWLTPAPSDHEFIVKIGHHYPFHVQQQLLKQSNTEDAYLMLLEEDRVLNYTAHIYRIRQQQQRETVRFVCKAQPYEQRSDLTDGCNIECAYDDSDDLSSPCVKQINTDDRTGCDFISPRSSSGGRCNGPQRDRPKYKSAADVHQVRNTSFNSQSLGFTNDVRLECLERTIEARSRDSLRSMLEPDTG